MRGILTHSLVQRGMDFKKAYQIAQNVKQSLSKIESITKKELRQTVDAEIKKEFGKGYLAELEPSSQQSFDSIQIIKNGSASSTFSKGLVTRSIIAAGIPPQHAHQMAQDLENRLYHEGKSEIGYDDLYKQIYQKILNESGEETAANYQLASRINQLDMPVIVYIGGVGGAGKSSLATELASRLNILMVTGTDTIRQIMRMVFTEQIMPALHRSSFEASSNQEEDLNLLTEGNEVITGFMTQSIKVNVGVRAVINRAVKENINMIIEGVHLLPSLIPFSEFADQAYHIPVVISVDDEKTHHARFNERQRSSSRKAERYKMKFNRIREIHDYFVTVAKEEKVPVINNVDFDHAINKLVQTVITNLQKQIVSNGDQMPQEESV